jgi:hypothetical protein
MTVEADVAARLGATVGGLTYGANVREGPQRKPTDNTALPGAVPHACVFCVGTGGIDDVPFVDGGASTSEKRPTVQVLVRSDPNDFDGGRARADACFAALNLKSFGAYHEVRALGSAPAYVHRDEQDHHVWSINVALRHC